MAQKEVIDNDSLYKSLEKMRSGIPEEEREKSVVQFLTPLEGSDPVRVVKNFTEALFQAPGGKTVLAEAFNFKHGTTIIAVGDESTIQSALDIMAKNKNTKTITGE